MQEGLCENLASLVKELVVEMTLVTKALLGMSRRPARQMKLVTLEAIAGDR